MSWLCEVCECNNVNSNRQCVYCWSKNNIVTLRPFENEFQFDSFEELLFKKHLEHNIRAEQLVENLTKDKPMSMTPEEELFATFFKNEAERIINLSDVDLRLRREKWIEIIREGKASLTAVREQERDREAKQKKASGFSRSIDSDDIASEAINRINKRNKNLSKMDKVIEGLMKIPGMTRKDAEAIASARNLKDHQEVKKSDGYSAESLKTPVEQKESKPFNNPFAPKAEPKPETITEVTIVDETNTIIIRETEVKQEESPKKPFNPFAKE